MKKTISIILLSFIAVLGVAAAETAASVLRRTADKLKAAKSLSVEYAISTDGHSMDGHLTVAANRFTLVSPQVRSWFDGKTQWTYSTHIGEINITEPTPEELQQINPFAIIQSFSKDYNASFLASPKGSKKMLLKAIDKRHDIRQAEVTVSEATGYPTHVTLTMASGQKVLISIKSVTPGGALPDSRFRFNAKDYPSIQVIDLR